MITKTLYVAFKYLKYWRKHSMVGDFEVTYSCLCIPGFSKEKKRAANFHLFINEIRGGKSPFIL